MLPNISGVEEQVRQTRQLPDQYLYKLLLENGNLCYFAQPMFNLPDQSPTASSTSAYTCTKTLEAA